MNDCAPHQQHQLVDVALHWYRIIHNMESSIDHGVLQTKIIHDRESSLIFPYSSNWGVIAIIAALANVGPPLILVRFKRIKDCTVEGIRCINYNTTYPSIISIVSIKKKIYRRRS